MPATPEPTAEALAPLWRCYEEARSAHPRPEFVFSGELPEPARWLLVHDSDMTSRLRTHHQSPIGLRVLDSTSDDIVVDRRVVLVRKSDDRIVEFGAIRIFLKHLTSELREAVLAGEEPLGGLLENSGMEYTSSPGAFFVIVPDDYICEWLGLESRDPVYGRCNKLRTGDEVFAEIVEILPNTPGLEKNTA